MKIKELYNDESKSNYGLDIYNLSKWKILGCIWAKFHFLEDLCVFTSSLPGMSRSPRDGMMTVVWAWKASVGTETRVWKPRTVGKALWSDKVRPVESWEGAGKWIWKPGQQRPTKGFEGFQYSSGDTGQGHSGAWQMRMGEVPSQRMAKAAMGREKENEGWEWVGEGWALGNRTFPLHIPTGLR